MHENPFSPSFSIRPERFFGRSNELGLMEAALDNPDSANRFLFMTGTRGCGKTSLLHQFALLARKRRWTVLETTYRDALVELRSYASDKPGGRHEITLKPSIEVPGISATLTGSAHGDRETPDRSVSSTLVSRLSKAKLSAGLFLAIDEIQKIPETDMEEICHAVQAAKTQGHDIALVIAGLPAAYQKIRHYPGCTFVQRMRRLRLGMLGGADTRELLSTTFARVPELIVGHSSIEELAGFSAGHPYLLQLAGSNAYEVAAETTSGLDREVIELNKGILREAEARALPDYQANVLHNLLRGARAGTVEYLKAMCQVADETSTASTAAIAHQLGRTQKECSSVRSRVIDLQLVDPVARGKLRFTLPYMPLAFENVPDDVTPVPEDALAPRMTPGIR